MTRHDPATAPPAHSALHRATHPHRSVRPRLRAAALAGVAAALFGAAARADSGAPVDARRCQVPDSFFTQAATLPQLALKLRNGKSIRIVAIGSSSTAGDGASSPRHAYPAQLAAELARLWPHAKLEVLNRGIGGERTRHMLARFDRDVLAEKPDLVIWQVGTNESLAGGPIPTMTALIHEGIDRLRRAGIEVVLMSPQFAPRFNEKADHLLRVEAVRASAQDHGVGVFRRFEIMQAWIAGNRMSMQEMLSPDGLHMNDLSYGCVAHLLARQIDRASRGIPAIAMPTPSAPAPAQIVAKPPAAVVVRPAAPAAAAVSAPAVGAPGIAAPSQPAASVIAPNTRF